MQLFDTFDHNDADVHAALALAADGVFSCRDALLVASALRAGCRTLISEDMQNGFRYGELEIVSPFLNGQLNPRPMSALQE